MQCDLLRPLRLPALLVGDGRLGGISATLSSHDSLLQRGYDVPLVALMEGQGLGNADALVRHLGGRCAVLRFPQCPAPGGGSEGGEGGWRVDRELRGWLEESAPEFDRLLALVFEQQAQRLQRLQVRARGGAPAATSAR